MSMRHRPVLLNFIVMFLTVGLLISLGVLWNMTKAGELFNGATTPATSCLSKQTVGHCISKPKGDGSPKTEPNTDSSRSNTQTSILDSSSQTTERSLINPDTLTMQQSMIYLLSLLSSPPNEERGDTSQGSG